MSNIRMKIAAGATILGLGGLGGYALTSNDAADAPAATLAATKQEPPVHTEVIRRTVHLQADGNSVTGAAPVTTGSSGSSGSDDGEYDDDQGEDDEFELEYEAEDDDGEYEDDDAGEHEDD